jgi:hypothetical protein
MILQSIKIKIEYVTKFTGFIFPFNQRNNLNPREMHYKCKIVSIYFYYWLHSNLFVYIKKKYKIIMYIVTRMNNHTIKYYFENYNYFNIFSQCIIVRHYPSFHNFLFFLLCPVYIMILLTIILFTFIRNKNTFLVFIYFLSSHI